MNAIPLALKHAITMGIGMFIALIGLVKAGFVHASQGGGPVTLASTRSIRSSPGWASPEPTRPWPGANTP